MKYFALSLTLLTLLIVTGCKPNPHPKNPRYEIKKPKVKYTPNRRSLQKMVKQLQGSPYVWAEEGPDRFDCSGFTYYMYGSMGIEIPRVAKEQAKVGKKVSLKELQYGDLIFFATDRRHPRKITHVGMYLGDGWFTHASTVKHEVIYSNLFTSRYYKRHLRVCRRYLPEKQFTITAATEPKWERKQTTSIPLATKAAATAAPKSKTITMQTPVKQVRQTQTQGNFYVQVGSYEGEPNASLIYKITREGFRYKIIKFTKRGKTISKLLIGPYHSRSSALEVRKKVRTTIQKDAFIAEVR